ncbi:MAG: M56 family metallopeptidase [Pseudomonadota bacterium]
MTAMKPVLDVIIDANVVFLLAFGLWWLVQTAMARSPLATDFMTQLRLLRVVLFVVLLSPLLSFLAVAAGQFLWPKTPITVADLAVAAYLRGEISIPALQFEALLNTRSRVIDMVLSGEMPLLTTLFAVLAAGVILQATLTLRAARRVSGVIAGSYLWRRTPTTDIRLSDTVAIPFAARGLFRRHVVLPSSILTNRNDLRVVLAHEFQHLRQGDVEWELAFELLRPLLFWNPVYRLWKQAFDRLRELSCDQAVIAARRITPRAYAECLLSFCERRVTRRWPRVMNVAFVRSGSRAARRALETRVLALEHGRGLGQAQRIVPLLALLLAVGIVLAAASVRQPGDWSQDRLMLSTIVNLERLDAINRGY